MLIKQTTRRFLQEQASKLYAYLRIRPLVLSLFTVPFLLFCTITIARTIDDEERTPAPALDEEIAPGSVQDDTEKSREIEHVKNPFGAYGRRFEGESIRFAYPPSWQLDTLLVKENARSYQLSRQADDALIQIRVRPTPENGEFEDVSAYLVDTFRSDPAFERYFLRQLVPFRAGDTPVEQIQFAAVTSEMLSGEGLQSERGIIAAFVNPSSNLVSVELSTTYNNSYGNYLRVDALKPVFYDLVGSMISEPEARFY